MREGRADDEERGHVPVVDEVVLRRPDRAEAKPLRLDRETDRVVVGARPVRLAGPELRAEESESECHSERGYRVRPSNAGRRSSRAPARRAQPDARTLAAWQT